MISGILFLVEVISFGLVCHWAYRNSAGTSGAGTTGLFALKEVSSPDKGSIEARTPAWRQRIASRSKAADKRIDTALGGTKARWKGTPQGESRWS